MAQCWSGTVALPGMEPFAAEGLLGGGATGSADSAADAAWAVVPQAVAHMGRTDGPALARHLQGLTAKRKKWSVSVAQIRGADDAARGACRSWCEDEKSKKVVAVECSGGSRLFLISPLASPREIVPLEWVAAELPAAPGCLLGVLARRLTPPTAAAAADEQRSGAAANGEKRAREAAGAGGAEQRGQAEQARSPKQRQRQRKKRRTTQQEVLPLTTTLQLGQLDFREVLAYRLANLAEAEEEEYDDGRPTLKNISVNTAIELFWEEESWFLVVAKKKTGRGVLFHYPQTDELEFIAKSKLRDYARKEHMRFLKGDVAAQIAAAKAEGEADDGEGDESSGPTRVRPEPPADFECGKVDVRTCGTKLKSMASNLPTAETLRTWNRECQLLFWGQRRSFWNGKKLSLLQQACRKHGLYPGGDVPDLKDRLIAREFDASLLTEEDTQTEEEAAAKRAAALGDSDSDSDDEDAPVFTLLSGD